MSSIALRECHVQLHWSCRMDTEERLRRRRERYRLRRDRETPEEAKSRRRRNSDYMRRRRSAMTAEQRRLERARNVQLSTPQSSPQTLSREVNDARKIWKFHTSLTCCSVRSSVCIEHFPSKSVDAINTVCRRCNNDEHIPADNNNTGPVPPEFTVSYVSTDYCLGNFEIKFSRFQKGWPISKPIPLHIKMWSYIKLTSQLCFKALIALLFPLKCEWTHHIFNRFYYNMLSYLRMILLCFNSYWEDLKLDLAVFIRNY